MRAAAPPGPPTKGWRRPDTAITARRRRPPLADDSWRRLRADQRWSRPRRAADCLTGGRPTRDIWPALCAAVDLRSAAHRSRHVALPPRRFCRRWIGPSAAADPAGVSEGRRRALLIPAAGSPPRRSAALSVSRTASSAAQQPASAPPANSQIGARPERRLFDI